MLLIHTSIPYMRDVMAPYYHMNSLSCLYFIAFVLVTNLFLFKLSIAVSYKSYRKHTESMVFKRLQKRKVALGAAFDLLAGADGGHDFSHDLSLLFVSGQKVDRRLYSGYIQIIFQSFNSLRYSYCIQI